MLDTIIQHLQGRGVSADARRARLYLITPPALDPRAFAERLAAGARRRRRRPAVQLRLKDADDDAIRRAAERARARRAAAAASPS